MSKVDKKIHQALKKTFNKSKIPNKISNLKIGDIKEWDSLGNFNFLLEIERVFNCRFESKIFNEVKSIKELKKKL